MGLIGCVRLAAQGPTLYLTPLFYLSCGSGSAVLLLRGDNSLLPAVGC